MSRRLLVTMAMALILAVLGAELASAQSTSEQYIRLMLVEGDSPEVRFTEPICAKRLVKGEVPNAVIAKSKIITSLVAVEEGAPVKVTVTEAKGNGRAGKAGRFVLTFDSVKAVDGAEIPLGMVSPVEREGKGKGIIMKVLTLFLAKGGDPCIETQERFHPKVKTTTAVYVDR
jgi:hypothetical protein